MKIDEIINEMADYVKSGVDLSPSIWLDKAVKLNVLRHEVDDKLYVIEHNLSVEKYKYAIASQCSNAMAENYIKTKDEYRQMKLLSAKIKQIEEFIKLAKKRATLKESEYSGY